jgi:hypothetical protein
MMTRLFAAGVVASVLPALLFWPDSPATGQLTVAEPQARPDTLNRFAPNPGSNPLLGFYGHSANDPELAKFFAAERNLEREAAKLVREYGATDKDGERTKLKAKLEEVLAKQFDAQQKRRDLELTRLETQLKKLRELMKKRSEAQQIIVEKRLDQLLREADGLGWTAPPGLTGPAGVGAYPVPLDKRP